MPNHKVFQLVVISQLVACAAHPADDTVSSSERNGRFQLRVSLYPWIPEPDSFIAFIEQDFEAKHPDIDLVVRPLVASYEGEPGFVADLAYESDKTAAALTDRNNPDFQDLIEIDTLTLGKLAEQRSLAPFPVDGAFLAPAIEAVTWGGQRLGVPHWTCGYFVISEEPAIRRARNVDELVATLRNEGTDRVDLAGALGGSWDAVTVYLDAFRDTYPHGNLQRALLRPELDPEVDSQLRRLSPACTQDGANFCGDDAADLFATGGADALIGFSERLNPILAHPAKAVGTLHVASATLGRGDAPTAFVDALVMSPRCASERCRRAARSFAEYYVSDEVFESSLMGFDTASGVPRYLLPSTSSAFEFGQVGQDRLFSELKHEFRNARAFPNSGVPDARDRGLIRQQVRAALGL